MLKKDINKLLKVKTEIDKFTGNYINSKGFTVQRKTKYINSSFDCKNIMLAYNNICKYGHAETIFKNVADIFKAFKFNVVVDENNINYTISI